MNLCIITARGGSKRIPKKNIKEFLGKPIIAYSIEAALKANIFDEVMVSTDSNEIAAVALKYGAKIPFMRSDKTSNDYAGTADVLREVLLNYEEHNLHFDTLCCIYPTAPFVTEFKLRSAYDILISNHADSVTPVVQYSYPPQRAFILQNGSLVYQYPEFKNFRSQDLEPIYHDCGQFYFYNTDVFLGKKKGAGKNLPIVMPEEEVQDIDNYSDWNLAEIKYKKFILEK